MAKRNNANNNAKQRATAKLPGGVTGKGFMPGQSGNPNGRPVTRGLIRVLKDRLSGTSEDGRTVEEQLVDVLLDEALNGKHRLSAIQDIFDRLEGRAKQRVELSETDELEKLTDEELRYVIETGELPEHRSQ